MCFIGILKLYNFGSILLFVSFFQKIMGLLILNMTILAVVLNNLNPLAKKFLPYRMRNGQRYLFSRKKPLERYLLH